MEDPIRRCMGTCAPAGAPGAPPQAFAGDRADKYLGITHLLPQLVRTFDTTDTEWEYDPLFVMLGRAGDRYS